MLTAVLRRYNPIRSRSKGLWNWILFCFIRFARKWIRRLNRATEREVPLIINPNGRASATELVEDGHQHDPEFTLISAQEDQSDQFLLDTANAGLQQLPEHWRIVFVEHFLRNVPLKNLEKTLGKPANLLKMYGFRAKQRLRAYMKANS